MPEYRRAVRCIGMALGVVLIQAASLGPAAAGERWAPDNNRCNQQPNTLAIVDCIEARVKFWDARLNQAWKAVNAMLASDPDMKTRLAPLKAAQLAWLKYRDANCAYYASGEGTIRQIETANCMLEMTQDRAIELQREGPQ